MSDVAPLQPEDVLRGLTGRRVSAVLYAVESRAGLLALTDRHAAAPAICEGMVATAERDYLAALHSGDDLPKPARIQHLERSAHAWAHLVPTSPAVRAGLAHALTNKYTARPQDVPDLRSAVGFETPEVVAAHEQEYGTAPDEGWVQGLVLTEHMRWWASRLSARLNRLSPFWSAFALTLTQTVGAGILALPIALAGVGPLPGLVLLIVLGLVNVFTVTAVAESVSRTGSVRWGGAYIGGVVRQHLGRYASIVTDVALVAFAVSTLTAYYIGLGTTLQQAAGLPASIVAAVLFLVTIGFVWRGRMDATITSAILVGGLNLVIIALLTVGAFTALDPGRLTRVDLSVDGSGGFDPSILGLVFGVVLMSYFGHTSVAAGARNILRRDPGGRSLVRGTATAMLTVVGTYCLWTLAVGGAVSGERLGGERGTVLEPLAEAVGPAVLVLGVVFVITAMGMGAVHTSVGLHAQAADLLRERGNGRILGLLPLMVVFVIVEALLLTDRASFTATLGMVGTLAIPVVAGIIPVLLLASARRRGDYVPAFGLGATAGVPKLVVAWLVFLAAVAAHGLVIWTGTIERILAGLTVLIIASLTVIVIRSEAFQPLTTLELRRDRDLDLDTLQLTTAGRPGHTEVTARSPDGTDTQSLEGAIRLPERSTEITLQISNAHASELKVWTHEVDAFGVSVPLATQVYIEEDPTDLPAGAAVVPLRTDREQIPVRILLRPERTSPKDLP